MTIEMKEQLFDAIHKQLNFPRAMSTTLQNLNNYLYVEYCSQMPIITHCGVLHLSLEKGMSHPKLYERLAILFPK